MPASPDRYELCVSLVYKVPYCIPVSVHGREGQPTSPDHYATSLGTAKSVRVLLTL